MLKRGIFIIYKTENVFKKGILFKIRGKCIGCIKKWRLQGGNRRRLKNYIYLLGGEIYNFPLSYIIIIKF